MKTAIIQISALCATLLLASSSCTATAHTATPYNDMAVTSKSGLTGSGNIITRSVTISDYTKIDASRAVNVVVEDRRGHDAVIRADDNIMPYVTVNVEGGTLVIGIDNEVKTLHNVSVTVSVPGNGSISAISASSASTVVVEPEIRNSSLAFDISSAAKVNIHKSDVGTCTVNVSSAGKIEGAIKADKCTIELNSAANAGLALLAVECNVTASSAAKAELSGEAGDIEIETSSAANVDALSLIARNVEADASSGSSIKITCMKSIDADASSGGSVKYAAKGPLASEQKNTSSGGSVKKL